MTALQWVQLIRRARSGESIQRLAAEYGTSDATARTRCYKAGVIPRYLRRVARG